MVALNLYVTPEIKQKLQEISDKEHRSKSKQLEHMLEFYMQHKQVKP